MAAEVIKTRGNSPRGRSDSLVATLSICHGLTVWALGFCIATAAHAQPSRTAEAKREINPSVTSDGRVLTTIFQGRRLAYEVVDGMAVHGGDIVLGTAEDVAAVSTRSQRRTSRRGTRDLSPQTVSAVDDGENLWPDGIIPYEIDSTVYETHPEQRQDIEAAIRSWNTLTVIRLIKRNGENDYVRIVRTTGTRCLSEIGMSGGEQLIAIAIDGCGPAGIVHAIGHTVGLWHEHQREDRDEYIALIEENLNIREYRTQWESKSPALGPYNFASTMHYGLHVEAPRFSTIPSGIPIPAGGLSAGDIDAVARLYGRTPRTITVSTNPPGLMVIVDGLEAIAPIKVVWSEGTTHSIEAPLVQADDSRDGHHVFGRWNDSLERIRKIEVSSESTWYEANYYEQRRPSKLSPAGRLSSLPVADPPTSEPEPDIGDLRRRIVDGVTSPRLLHQVEPEYSNRARKARYQGLVPLEVEIWEDGRAHNIRVVKSLGYGLDEKAIEAVKQWRFSPGMKDGKPVRVAATIHVNFRLLGFTPPQVLRKVEPTYSEEARQAGLEGLVTLAVKVLANGTAGNIRVAKSLGLGLDEKAVEAVRKWKFKPGETDGKSVSAETVIEVRFQLPSVTPPMLPYKIDPGVTPPRALHKTQPEYSAEAHQAHLQGSVFIAAVVGKNGNAHDVRVLQGLGLGLDEKAVEAVRKWKFQPAKKAGEPVRAPVMLQVNFRLLDMARPLVLHRVEPEYSLEARRARLQGSVILTAEIAEDGIAYNIGVVQGLGLGLDEKAVEAVRKWKFQPGEHEGEPVRSTAQIQVNFRLP